MSKLHKKVQKIKSNVFTTDFNDVPITTKTKNINTNWNIDIERVFNECKIKDIQTNPDVRSFYGLKNGDIVCMDYRDRKRGVRPLKERETSNFLNNLTVIMWVRGGEDITESKFVNFKISKNGRFQITGCKKREHGIYAATFMWKKMVKISRETDTNVMKLNMSLWKYPVAIIRTDLINMDFTVGYTVDRKKVDMYVKREVPNFISILETSHGYTGVNIKIPVREPEDRVYRTLEWKDSLTKPDIVENSIDEFYSLMSVQDVKKHQVKQRYITLLIFQSGGVIISGSFIEGVRDAYEWVKKTFANEKFKDI